MRIPQCITKRKALGEDALSQSAVETDFGEVILFYAVGQQTGAACGQRDKSYWDRVEMSRDVVRRRSLRRRALAVKK
jgi:hypothetical protein